MNYLNLILSLDTLCRFYPKYFSNEYLILAEDILKWLNGELPEDSSTLVYLKDLYNSPTEALQLLWQEIQLLAHPFRDLN